MKSPSEIQSIIQAEKEDDDMDEEIEFIPCDKCDGHPACEDFGCAFDLGLGRMVKKDNYPGNDNW